MSVRVHASERHASEQCRQDGATDLDLEPAAAGDQTCYTGLVFIVSVIAQPELLPYDIARIAVRSYCLTQSTIYSASLYLMCFRAKIVTRYR